MDSSGLDWHRFVAQPDGETLNARFSFQHAGHCVLITGAGGSIGSALAKAIAGGGVERLLLLDSSEIGLFQLQWQIASACPDASFEIVLGSVDDAGLLDWIFSRHHVDVIYHAAAWKQVGLLESNPFSAVRNNGVGTYILAQAAIRGGVEKLVLVSTDKAVNPRSIMGASKRIAELVVASLSSPRCRMNAIRLCNVIGSSGSVVPIFLRQIERREPLTVTDPQVTRWFLTIGQTVEAILACGASAEEGKILLPTVGEAVHIADLARFLIHQAGNGWPGELAYIGLRPGEKLREELMFERERKVRIEDCLTVLDTPSLGAGELSALMCELGDRIKLFDLPGMLRAIQSVVPEYAPAAQLLRT
jgi:FlaA1/EpsC-like NDP-sugar epimerase